MISLPHGMYMAESEGMLSTRESAIRNIIQEVRKYPGDTCPDLVFYSICANYGITAGSLSKAEFNRIKRAIER